MMHGVKRIGRKVGVRKLIDKLKRENEAGMTDTERERET